MLRLTPAPSSQSPATKFFRIAFIRILPRARRRTRRVRQRVLRSPAGGQDRNTSIGDARLAVVCNPVRRLFGRNLTFHVDARQLCDKCGEFRKLVLGQIRQWRAHGADPAVLLGAAATDVFPPDIAVNEALLVLSVRDPSSGFFSPRRRVTSSTMRIRRASGV